MPVVLRVQGHREFIKALRQVDVNLPKALRAAGLEAAVPVAAAARAKAPVGPTGRLQASIRPGATQRGASVRAGSAAVPYAGPIHFGWPARNITPNPFLYDAADARRAAVVSVYERRIRDVIHSAGF